jgi:hypothetical protein
MLTYEELRPTLFEVIDYLFKEEDEQFRNIKKEYYDTFMLPINDFRFSYTEDQYFNQLDQEHLDNDQRNTMIYTSEKKIKLTFIQRLNEAFQIMYKFHD